ncbi:unnamed protein product [Clonostachys rosea f. rosea IK726]|uniref:Uncharacterized protein n=2 Tax=Bionectria ochroleuca TaxID=29856 RepID=A0A0B7KG59_BIOOC|nr:unnamed protein product [Clonostachys rosea f. rosea IK726]
MAPQAIVQYENIPDDLRQIGDDIVLAYKSYTRSRVLGAGIKLDDDNLHEAPMAGIKEELWRLAFSPSNESAWNPLLPVPKANLPDAPKHKDLRVSCGFLSSHAPPSTCKAPSPRHRKPDEIEYFWADERGKGVNLRITNLYTSGTPELIEKVKMMAIAQRDEKVMQHAIQYNKELAAYWLRCRLARALQERFPEMPVQQRVSNPTRADFEEFVRPLILRNLIPEDGLKKIQDEHHALFEELADGS